MSYALRYGLTALVLAAGSVAALQFRATDEVSATRGSSNSLTRAGSREAVTETGDRRSERIVPIAGAVDQEPRRRETTGASSRVGNSSGRKASHSSQPARVSSGESEGGDDRRTPGGREYRVRPGDSLATIAATTLGDADRYRDLYALNRDRLAGPNDLFTGMILRLPADADPPTDSGGASSEALSQVPEFQLEFAPIEANPDTEHQRRRIIPARGSPKSDSGDSDGTRGERDVVPARDHQYLPRAFRRDVDEE